MKHDLSTKRGQAEAFGLIIIVGLVLVVFIILARMEQNRDTGELKQSYEVTELSSSTINTLFTTVVPSCNRKTFDEVLIDCIKNPVSTCSGVSSCDVFVSSSAIILDAVFERVNMGYRMSFSTEGRTLPDALSEDMGDGRCSEEIRGETYPLPLNPGTLAVTLAVCPVS